MAMVFVGFVFGVRAVHRGLSDRIFTLVAIGKVGVDVSSFGACALTAAAGKYGLWFGSFSRQAYFEFGATLASAIVGALLVIKVQQVFSSGYTKLREASRTDHAAEDIAICST